MPESPNKLLNNDHGNYVSATFTGHIYDTTLDIYFAEARFYDADNRTWLAADPIKDGGNWYQYCNSNPTTYWDPTGLWGTVTGTKQAKLSGSEHSDILGNIDWNRVGIGVLKGASAAMVLAIGITAVVATGAAAVTFGVADVLEASQDLGYGVAGSSKASFNPLRDTRFTGNENLYYNLEMLATLFASAGTATFRSFDMESEINASKMAGFGQNSALGSDSTSNAFSAPQITTNKKGELTNGTYTLNQKDMLIHVDGKNPNKSQFLYDVDANKAVLDASAYADANNLWEASIGNLTDLRIKQKFQLLMDM